MPRILIVEDTAVVREPIAQALGVRGFDVHCAVNGHDALQQMTSCKPDLILLDLNMPVMDGPTFLKHLRSDPKDKDIPVIVLTAISEKMQVINLIKLGIADYILKAGFSLDELETKIRRCLNKESGQNVNPQETRQTIARKDRTPIKRVQSVSKMQCEFSSDASMSHRVERLRSLTPIASREEVKALIDEAGELKSFSPSVMMLMKLTGNPKTTIEQVVRAVGSDQNLAVKLLALANSSAYARGEPVDSIRKAVVRIGLNRLRETAMNLAVIDKFSEMPGSDLLHLGRFWEHSISTAIIAADLANSTIALDTDSAFTMGLIHDVGRLVMMQALGDRYVQVIEAAKEHHLPLEQVETRMLLMNHADVMDRLLHHWQFPKQLTNPVVFHHLSVENMRSQAPKEMPQLVVLATANRIAKGLLIGTSGNDFIYSINEFLNYLELSTSNMTRITERVEEQAKDMKMALLSNSGFANWSHMREELLESSDRPLNFHYVANSNKHDLFSLFFDRLTTDRDIAPNLLVCHLQTGRDEVQVSHEIKRLEDAGTIDKSTPLLVISPQGKLSLSREVMSGRLYQLLPEPLDARTMIRVSNQMLVQQEKMAA